MKNFLSLNEGVFKNKIFSHRKTINLSCVYQFLTIADSMPLLKMNKT